MHLPEAVKEQMQASDFLLYSDRLGHVADFHSLRVLFISRVVASGASVKDAQEQRATGTCGRADAVPKSAHESAHMQPAQEGSGWHSGASVRAADCSEMSAAQNAKTPAKPERTGALRGSSRERLRSESNRRWRICNPVASPENTGENPASAESVHTDVHSENADPALSAVVEAWSSLPPAVRAGILAMVEASKR